VQYHYVAGTQARGAFSLDQLSKEEITIETMVWHGGLSDWVRADSLPALKPLLARLPPPVPTMASDLTEPPPIDADVLRVEEWEKIRQIARWQRYLNVAALVLLLVTYLIIYTPWLYLVDMPVMVWMVGNLAAALGRNKWIWGVCSVIPLVNLVVLLTLSHQANASLRNAGISVGFLGATTSQEPPESFQLTNSA